MTLRLRLALSLMLAALLPMGVAVGVVISRAERRASEDAARRLEAARRRAVVLIERYKAECVARLEAAADDLVRDGAALDSLLRAQSRPASSELARSLAVRAGLDHLEILSTEGTTLSSSRLDASTGLRSTLSDLTEDAIALRPLPLGGGAGPGAGGADGRSIAFFARRRAVSPRATFVLAGGRAVGGEIISMIAAVSGEPAALVDGNGTAVLTSGDIPAPGERISADVPLGGIDWKVRVSVPAGDVKQARRDLLGIFGGIAPFALVSALAVGWILAERISRPIRALAARAESISRERAGGFPLSLLEVRDEVRRLTLCFDRMLEALSDSERQRIGAERIGAWQEVAQRIAHEVKNPLSPIKLAVENLRRMRATGTGDFERAFEEETTSILEEVESLRRLVDEFSQFVRLPRPRLVPCDLRELVAQARGLFASRLEAAGIRVEIDDSGAPGPVLADPQQIGRVLKNIIANAIDAMEPVQDRRLSIAVAHGSGPLGAPAATIEVRDSGVGLAPEALRRIFEPYYTTRGDRGGTGLGMAIAYRIVTEHGGTIQAAGAPGRGATITIRLPIESSTGGAE